MKVNILSDRAVSANLAAGDSGSACAYPLSIRLKDGSLCCVYRQGSSKHSVDSLLLMQTSEDRGETWSAPRVVFDGLKRTPPTTLVSPGLCQTADGHLMVIFGSIEGLKPGVYMFSREGRALPHPLLVTRSADGGQSWSEPRPVPHPTLPTAGVTSRPFPLADGTICIPLEYKLAPTGPNGSAMIFSRDNGQTFDPSVVVAADHSGELNLCDARYDLLPDGRILALIWTFREDTEETIEVRRSYSSDGGQTWTVPENIEFVGQVTAPVVLPDGSVVAATNYRLPPEGIRLWGSRDGGENWAGSGPIQMWDPVANRMVGESVVPPKEAVADAGGLWEALDRFTFGTPDLVLLSDGSLLMTYYATLDGITHVRACRFRVVWD
ncbi:MAG: sialidase family protein [Acidobacteriota bacterium]|nr:sialidase family protein [Acidobacteriota bacterium]